MSRKISRWSTTQNETFRRWIVFAVPGSDPVEYEDLTGYTLAMQVRSKAGATGNAEATATVTVNDEEITAYRNGEPVTIPAGRAALVEIPSTQTVALKPGDHAFDLIRMSGDDVEVVRAGEFYVYARVTIPE